MPPPSHLRYSEISGFPVHWQSFIEERFLYITHVTASTRGA
jgi:hypothetical protein